MSPKFYRTVSPKFYRAVHTYSAAVWFVSAAFMFVMYWPLSHLPLLFALVFGGGALVLGVRDIVRAARGPRQPQKSTH
ncbi:hypothetical protein HDA32_005914 [Spinactinospora alkalitolerans]|uniref:Uncharacterized protein n=1 Tax=Spinactinospora alkalitolerans TaxID=687207 RepID=A0A852U9K5_9ACTN|nr:hypothetical protein [Spinactinospora alkalitolerans]NYE50794.1 hypothetical protein [Spinactinospora alkalitolerans]